MAFYGSNFTFNGVSSEEFDLMLYDIGGNGQENSEFASTVSIIEEDVITRWKPVFYGVRFENKLEFNLVFGVNQDRIDAGKYLDRYELNAIASWLTGLDGYKYLTIDQDDMTHVRYKCYVSSLSVVEYGMIPWALDATITCDGPFAYMAPTSFIYDSNSGYVNLLNESGYNGYYYPKVTLYASGSGGGSLSITNLSDNNRVFEFTNLPASITTINVDCENGTITNNADLNLYDYFNFNFLRLKRGYNKLSISGDFRVTIICEFPINVGG